MGMNNQMDPGEELYVNVNNKNLEAESDNNINNKKKLNFIYEDYNKIVAKKEIFSQFPESVNKENIYIGNKLKIGFSKK